MSAAKDDVRDTRDKKSAESEQGKSDTLADKVWREACLIGRGVIVGSFQQGAESLSEHPIENGLQMGGTILLGAALACAQKRVGALKLGAELLGSALAIEFFRDAASPGRWRRAGEAWNNTLEPGADMDANVTLMRQSLGDYAFHLGWSMLGGTLGTTSVKFLRARFHPGLETMPAAMVRARSSAATGSDMLGERTDLTQGVNDITDVRPASTRQMPEPSTIKQLAAANPMSTGPDSPSSTLVSTNLDRSGFTPFLSDHPWTVGASGIAVPGVVAYPSSSMTPNQGLTVPGNSAGMRLLTNAGGDVRVLARQQEVGIALIGPPGSGKTTLINALAQEGVPVVHEQAEQVIREGMREGRPELLPWVDRPAFQSEVMRRQLAAEALRRVTGPAAFDRGAFDGEAYARRFRQNNLKLFEGIDSHRYPVVFLTEPLPQFEQNGIRIGEDLNFAWDLWNWHREVYSIHGVPIVDLQASTPQLRLRFVMDWIEKFRPGWLSAFRGMLSRNS